MEGFVPVLHLAAGIVMAVVGLELMPEAPAWSAPTMPISAIVGGEAFFMGVERVLGSVRRRLGAGEESNGPLAIFTGMCLDLFSDGVMTGTATILEPVPGPAAGPRTGSSRCARGPRGR